MLKDMTVITTIDKDDVVSNYDAFAVTDTENNSTTLFLLMKKIAGYNIYLTLYDNGVYDTWEIGDYEEFSNCLSGKYVIYDVNKDSIKFNDVEYKRNV